jgi:hypothetical protein
VRTLYNHYINNDIIFSRIPESEGHKENHTRQNVNFFNFFKQDKSTKNAGLSGILKRFKLEDIDTGDILLLLILVFILLEGDNWELALILGLVLFLSLRSDDSM